MRSLTALPILAILGLLPGTGCIHFVDLKTPYNAEMIGLNDEAGPEMSWDTEVEIDPQHALEYQLVVCKTSTFKDSPVLTRKFVDEKSYRLSPDEGWLAGGSEYFWKVEGVVRDKEGAVVEDLRCRNPRSFYLDKRPILSVDLALPEVEGIENPKVKIGNLDFGASPSFEMEKGERRSLSLSFTRDGAAVVFTGELRVLDVPEQAKYDRVQIENLTLEVLDQVSSGKPQELTYKLGETEVLSLSLN